MRGPPNGVWTEGTSYFYYEAGYCDLILIFFFLVLSQQAFFYFIYLIKHTTIQYNTIIQINIGSAGLPFVVIFSGGGGVVRDTVQVIVNARCKFHKFFVFKGAHGEQRFPLFLDLHQVVVMAFR